jgi:hypothetical protein
MKATLKLKLNPIRKYLEFIIYPIKSSTGSFFLIKSRGTIHLSIQHNTELISNELGNLEYLDFRVFTDAKIFYNEINSR